MPQLSSKTYRKLAVSLIAIHLAITLPLAYALNIWADEGSTLYTTQHGFVHAFYNASLYERQAPLYFWAMSLWRSVDPSIFFARLFSVLCGAFSIWLFSETAKRLFAGRAAILATAFFALNPFLLWASLEIRVYALVILLSVVLIGQFFTAFDETNDERKRQRARVLLCTACCIALYANYYLGFLFPAFIIALLAQRRWRDARDLVVILLPSALMFIPQVFVIKEQLAANAAGFREDAGIVDGVRTLYHHVLIFLLPAGNFLDEAPTILRPIRLIVLVVFAVTTAAYAVWKRISISATTIRLFVLNSVVFAIYLAAFLAVGPKYIAIRHASACFVAVIFLAASILKDVFDVSEVRARRPVDLVCYAAGVVVLGAFVYSAFTIYPSAAKRGDWSRVAAFIEANEGPGQPIIIFTAFDALAFKASYKGQNRVLPDDGDTSYYYEARSGSEASLKDEAAFALSEIPKDADEIWIAANEKCVGNDACVLLENYLLSNYTVVREANFYKEKVRQLRKIR